MAKSRVAVLKTSPRRVLSDYHELLNLAGYQDEYTEKLLQLIESKVNAMRCFAFFGQWNSLFWRGEGVLSDAEEEGKESVAGASRLYG